jgi:hypothetical protein
MHAITNNRIAEKLFWVNFPIHLSLIGAFHILIWRHHTIHRDSDCKDGEDKPASGSELLIKIMFRHLTLNGSTIAHPDFYPGGKQKKRIKSLKSAGVGDLAR